MKTKLYDWNIEDYLRTPEERAAYIEAAVEENDLAFLAQALADVAKATKNRRGAAVMSALVTCFKAAAQIPMDMRPRRTAKREPAMA